MSEKKLDSDKFESKLFSNDSTGESLLSRLRLIIWPQHEPLIACILLCCVIGMSIYFIQRSYIHNGLIEIDHAGALHAEFLVDINQAELGEIVVLPGVGQKLAQAILDHRHQQGSFDSLTSLKDVPGIGDRKFESLLPYLIPINSK